MSVIARFRRHLPLSLLVLLQACGDTNSATDRTEGAAPGGAVLALAAADLQVALTEIARQYQERTGSAVDLVFGSTGNLTTQIENGAPADVFFAANERFIDRLMEGGHARAATRVVYGTGRLAVVAAAGVPHPRTLEDLANPDYRTIAIANPEHAPYGVAAREALLATGTWERVQQRLVFGENVAQTLQFVRTGNAEVGIVALGLVVGDSSVEHTLVDESLHSPLRQAAAVLSDSQRPEQAQAFLDFVMGPEGQEVLDRFGFGPPSR